MGIGKVGEAKHWRVSTVNQNYKHAPSYPALLVVPASLTDEELMYVYINSSR